MRNSTLFDLLAATAAILCICGALGVRQAATNATQPPPNVTPTKPDNTRRPLLPLIRPRDAGDKVVLGDRAGPAGQIPLVDYPESEWFKNIGSKLDGAGMCVFTAFEFSCRWAGLEEFVGFRDWAAAKYKGGGWPEKLDEIVDAYCKAKGLKKPTLLQYSGDNPAFLEATLANGWLPGCTLFRCPKYGTGIIYHMTNMANLGKDVAILDNNFPDYYWFAKADLKTRIMNPDPNTRKPVYWGFAVVAPPPPWIPKN